MTRSDASSDEPPIEPVEVPDHHDAPGWTKALLEATNGLSANVLALTERLDTSRKMARRTRILALAVAALVLVFGATGWAQWERATDAIEETQANAVQNCENANQARAANLQLWTYILSLASADSPKETQQIADLKAWITVLYAQRDCSDLDREYPIPPAPTTGS